jgi:hypothetical protein
MVTAHQQVGQLGPVLGQQPVSGDQAGQEGMGLGRVVTLPQLGDVLRGISALDGARKLRLRQGGGNAGDHRGLRWAW